MCARASPARPGKIRLAHGPLATVRSSMNKEIGLLRDLIAALYFLLGASCASGQGLTGSVAARIGPVRKPG